MPTREEEFSRVRELMDYPKYGRPSPHSIVSELIRQEQFQMNRLGNTRRPWSQGSTTVTSVADTAEYTITPSDFGKPLFAYRALESNVLLPVPFTDYTNEVGDQKYDFFIAPNESGLSPTFSGEKVAFFRTAAGVKKMRVYPVPETAGVVYTIVYASGWQDWSAFAISGVPIMPEWSDFRTIAVALFKLPSAEWEGLTKEENTQKRRELGISLQAQFALQEQEFASFVRNPTHEPIGEVGYWHE